MNSPYPKILALWHFAVGLFGFIMVMATFIYTMELFDAIQIWTVATASGYDTDTFNFFVALEAILPIIFVISLALWAFIRTQKRQDEYI